MKPHPRIRKTIKWGGAALTVLLVVVWIGSGWIRVFRDRGLTTWGLTRGTLWKQTFSTDHGFRKLDDWRVLCDGTWNLDWDVRSEDSIWVNWIQMPFWPLVLVVGLPTAFAFRLDTLARRRARMNLCAKCHYDRTGLAAGAVCPECGTGSGSA